MPQGKRTPAEKVAFKHMLSNINLLYLGCHVLVLLDLSYMSRFWVWAQLLNPRGVATRADARVHCHFAQTQFEAWLAMQQTTANGLKSCSVEDSVKRCTVVPIYNANSIIVRDIIPTALRTMWANKTPKHAYEILKQEDVTVTNQSDKAQQLPKIRTLDEDVRAVLGGEESAASLPAMPLSAPQNLTAPPSLAPPVPPRPAAWPLPRRPLPPQQAARPSPHG